MQEFQGSYEKWITDLVSIYVKIIQELKIKYLTTLKNFIFGKTVRLNLVKSDNLFLYQSVLV